MIRKSTKFNVGHYCGEMGQDFWDARRWQREFDNKDVHCSVPWFLLSCVGLLHFFVVIYLPSVVFYDTKLVTSALKVIFCATGAWTLMGTFFFRFS